MYTTALVLTQNNTKVENILYWLSVTNPFYDKVESSPSETLVAWTDPAFPAFVEVSLVKPKSQVIVQTKPVLNKSLK